MKILLVIEHDNTHLKGINLHTLAAALELTSLIDCLVVGFQCEKVVEAAQLLPEVKKVLWADAKEYEHQLAENTAELIAKMAADYDVVLTGSSTFGKNILPRVSGLLDVQMISDVVQILAEDTFVRPIYAGNALETVKISDRIRLLTIRATAFPASSMNSIKTATIEKINDVIPNTLSHFVEQKLTESTRPELTGAKIIVSGGRGLKSAENFRKLEKFADAVGAAIGASRAAVDAGFAPNDYQVGQTGKVVAPDLYIAVGISGAIQHLAGMKDSKIIVAINSDPEAPIFQVADYGLVADLFTVLPELETELSKRN